jgi:hypothetical protein
MRGDEWDRRVDEMSPANGVALRLERAGYDDLVIAAALGVPLESVPALLEVARAKLAWEAAPPPTEAATPPTEAAVPPATQ